MFPTNKHLYADINNKYAAHNLAPDIHTADNKNKIQI